MVGSDAEYLASRVAMTLIRQNTMKVKSNHTVHMSAKELTTLGWHIHRSIQLAIKDMRNPGSEDPKIFANVAVDGIDLLREFDQATYYLLIGGYEKYAYDIAISLGHSEHDARHFGLDGGL